MEIEKIGTASNPYRVAIIGSGPSGFYAADELLKQEGLEARVDLFDRLPTPYGLVRGGVAPDHQKIKSVVKLFERVAGRPGFRFFGNISFGQQLTLAEVLAHYHHLLICTGADSDRKMGIPGEDLEGSFPATTFVAWYNGHPDFSHYSFDLSGERAAVIGNGNVAMDVVRILTKPLAELEKTDIADHALATLRGSNIKEIYLLGRRGPAQAAFTNPEIRELTSIEGVELHFRKSDLDLDDLSREFLEQAKDPARRRNMEIMTSHLEKEPGGEARKIHAWFFSSPTEVLGEGKVAGLRIEKNRLVKDDSGALKARGTGESEEIPIQLLFRSIGYRGTALPEVPFDEWAGIIPNEGGRVIEPEGGARRERLYVAGWIKRGPSGVIGTNKPDALSTVKAMLADLPQLEGQGAELPAGEEIGTLLRNKGARPVSFDDWKKLDRIEVERGASSGRPRVKFTSVKEMLAALEG